VSQTPAPRAGIELWAGPECTVARLGDSYVDQLELTGHDRRPDDLALFADLGIAAIRYPVLWESVARNGWRRPLERFAALRAAGVRPIAGLIHHGSGPRHTQLLDPRFPEQLAEFAREAAERLPWVEEWTPVNEPLTTARFSALYGHWYPHASDDRAFARALLAQCRAVVLAMQEIRRVNPRARLVQTDDLGRTHSTPRLAYQAAFENERRWLTFDLLSGRLEPASPAYEWLRWVGIEQSELDLFRQEPCPPDVIGLNHYLSSERFLDERLDRYPAHEHGGNGRDRYADTVAYRVLEEPAEGFARALREAWDRYASPIALTEVHNGCTREEQLRWLAEGWNAATEARARGIDVRAVTVWALLGAYDWDSLLTRRRGRYEPGAFDVSGGVGVPRPTALAGLARALGRGEPYDHPALDAPGWWRRPVRFLSGERAEESPQTARRLLITGATGTLGKAFARVCHLRGLPYILASRREMDIADAGSVAGALESVRPWAVVNTAGYVRVDDAERDEIRCRRENTLGPRTLAEACASSGTSLVTFSSDLVFDGQKGSPYLEDDPIAPLGVYGRTKAEAEQAVLTALPEALVVRTSAFFGPWDEHNFATLALRTFARGEAVRAPGDVSVSPTYVPDLVNAALDLLIDRESGIWHLANPGEVSWSEFARAAADAREVAGARVEEVALESLSLPAPRPRYSVLGSARFGAMPPLEDALARWAAHLEIAA
jgi:dTDP-4-dehydrorhamnose reductase